MARKRTPERDIAKEIFLKSKGTLTPKEIAEKMKLPAERIRKWKNLDKWEDELKKKKRGAKPGNQYAKGHGAPKGNKNAEVHGGYSAVDLKNLSEEDRTYIETITLESEKNMLEELQILRLKEKDIRRRMDELDTADEETIYLTKVSEMHAPLNLEKLEILEPEEREKLLSELKPQLKTITSESKFERQQKLLAAFDKIHGRIIKLLDTIKGYQTDNRRLELDALRYDLSVQKITGAIDIDPFEDDDIEE